MTDTNKLDIQVDKFFLNTEGEIVEITDQDLEDPYCHWWGNTSDGNGEWYPIDGRFDEDCAGKLDLIQECDQHGNPISLKEQTMTKKTPRKHAELIKQWADDDSLVVECREKGSHHWYETSCPIWDSEPEYRFKPKEPVYEYQLLVKSYDGYRIHGEWFTQTERNNYIINHGSEDVILILESERLRQE